MRRKATSGIMLTLLLLCMLTLTFNIQSVKASGTIYIRADGSIDPSTANITSPDNVTYTFTANINASIVVQKNNTVVDGAGYTLQGLGSGRGIYLSGISNVTIENTEIKAFERGIQLRYSSNNTITGNTIVNNKNGTHLLCSSRNTIIGNDITNNLWGVFLEGSSNNRISRNNVTSNQWFGIILEASLAPSYSNHNSIIGNKIANSEWGVYLIGANNSFCENSIANNHKAIYLFLSFSNRIYHNNFLENINQVDSHGSVNIWDDGYPSGGNYWSNYTGVDDYSGINQDEPGSDGIVDTPYVIDTSNQDNYPLVEPWIPPKTPEQEILDLIDTVESMNFQQGIDNSLDSKLQNALDSLEALNADQRNDAINKLEAFINAVEAQRGNKITDEQADYLISEAQRIIDLING